MEAKVFIMKKALARSSGKNQCSRQSSAGSNAIKFYGLERHLIFMGWNAI